MCARLQSRQRFFPTLSDWMSSRAHRTLPTSGLSTIVAVTSSIVLVFSVGCGFDGDNQFADSGPVRDASGVLSDAEVEPSDASLSDGNSDADAMPPDAMPPDAMLPDAAAPDAGVFEEPDYDFLSETGLYDDIDNKVIAAGIYDFDPEFELWSDDAGKERWIYLPPGATIDSSDMDNWDFPTGTKIWKLFTHEVDGNTVLLETRLTEVWGPAPGEIYQAAFVWNANDTDAAYSRFGASNIKNTDHDAPARDQCVRCHRGQESRVLGFQAVQLSHGGNNDIDYFELLSWFSDSPDPGGYPVPGNATERAAIGYLHANCGGCHTNANGSVAGQACYALPLMQLRVRTANEIVQDTYAYLHLVDQDLQYWVSSTEGNEGGYTKRIDPGSPATSAVYYRMGFREVGQAPPFDDHQQMPTIFTDLVDPDGLAAIEAWILSL